MGKYRTRRMKTLERLFNRDLSELVRDWLSEGYTRRQIAEKLGVGESTFYGWLPSLGIKRTYELKDERHD